MGAGSSTEQRSPEQPEAGSPAPAEPQPGGGPPEPEAAPSAPGDPAIHGAGDPATKVLQKNGQLSTVNSLAEEGELSIQEDAPSGEEDAAIVTEVGQRGSEDVSERDSVKDMATNSPVTQDPMKEGPEEMSEILEQVTPSEGNLEGLAQPPESQNSDVGFKKVFKFVGLKFTVKRDKNDKSDAVQLLTVKKEDSEAAAEGSQGAGDHPEPTPGGLEATSKEEELKQSTEKPEEEEMPSQEQTSVDTSLPAEPTQPAEGGRDEGEEKPEKEPPKSLESPTSPQASETASPFKKFFTQGWVGWRKKTSFRKPKEEDLETAEKKKEPEAKRVEQQEDEKGGDAPQKPAAGEPPAPPVAPGGVNEARLSAEYEKVELPIDEPEEGAPQEKVAPLATEVFDEKVEVVADIHVSTVEQSQDGEEAPQLQDKTDERPQDAERAEKEEKQEEEKIQEASASGGDRSSPPELSPDEGGGPPVPPEGILSEAEMLSSQERTKAQGSPLKKLFTSSGLKKLSAKKQKGKGGGGAEEEAGEHHSAPESPDSPEEQRGDSSASSPEEPEEPTSLEKGAVKGPQDPEGQEGPPSEGEKKREGITPWASFKKMVTPKKRMRRPSDSDREEELERVKSATLSSAESATSELHDEARGATEEPKRRVDTSVSWEALICVGSSKKRARKASSSDEDEGPKATTGDIQKTDDSAGKDKEAGAEVPAAAGPQEPDAGPGSPSSEQAGSPSDGEGVSTWESFKRLVTPRKKSKSKLEEKHEEPAPGSGIETLAPDAEASGGREETWVSIKKLIPGRKKKRHEGKPEQASVGSPPDVPEEDSDVPAVVPLAEFDAVEREKVEAQEATQSEERPAPSGAVHVSEEVSQSLVHTVRVTVIEGAKVVTDMEERSPSWISTSVTGPLEQEDEEAATPAPEQVAEGGEVTTEARPSATLPERDASRDTLASEVEVTSEAVTAIETTGASGAEETMDMVSAVSQLTESPATTEEATPVQEAEGGPVDQATLERHTQAVLQAVVEKVSGESLPRGPGDTASKRPEGAEEAERGQPVQEEEQEGLQAPPESQGIVLPSDTEPGESTGLRTSHPADEDTAGAKSEMVLEQGTTAPDSSETLTDSETNESTPVTEFEAVSALQQDRVTDTPRDDETATSASESKVPEGETAPASSETPPAPSSPQSSGEEKDCSKPEEALEHPDGKALSKTEEILGSGPGADDKTQDVPAAGEHTGSTDGVGQKTLPAAALRDETAEEAEGEGAALCRPEPVVAPMERGVAEAKAERARSEAEPGQPPALAESKKSSQAKLSFNDGTKEGLSLEESPSLVQEETEGTAVQSSEMPPAAGPEEKDGGETVGSLETPELLASAGAPLVQTEKVAQRMEDSTVQPEERAVAAETESLATAVPAERGISPESEGDKTPRQCDESAVGQEIMTEDEDSPIEAESSKLVENVIQTVVEGLVSGEGTAPKVPQGSGPLASDKETTPKTEMEGETHTPAATKELIASDVSKEESDASERTALGEVVEDQQVEEAGEAARTESVPEDAAVDGGSGGEKSLSESPRHRKDEVVDCSENPKPALADSETSGSFTKESPDTNGPKLTEKGGSHEGKFLEGKEESSESEKELKAEVQEETSQN